MKLRTMFVTAALLFTTQVSALTLGESFGSGNTSYQRVVFSGYRFGSDGGREVSIGVGLPISGGLYSFAYADVGSFGSLNSEIAYLFSPAKRVHVGFVAGPNVDWLNTPMGDELTSYLSGAAGGVLAFSVNAKFGVWAYGKYKFAFDNGTHYQNGHLVGVGVYLAY
jgi:hypothetical protein